MKQIGRKIYYEISTGNIIVDTGERSGNVVETTVEEDFQAYVSLSERLPDSVGIMRLDYGQYAQDFAESTGVRVNPVTSKLEFSYGEPQTPIYTKSLAEEVAELKLDNLALMSALADVYEQVLTLQSSGGAA